VELRDAARLGLLDAHAQADLLRRGEVTAGELADAAIRRIEALDPEINAVSHRAYETGLERAGAIVGGGDGLAGVPYLLKDGLDYPGMPANVGSRYRVNHPYVAQVFDYTRRLDAAGLVPLGKTSATEFGLLPTTEPLLYGPVQNPWAHGHSPGGSSGGAAAAVAAGMVPIAHAADGGGSIRIPASCCGLVGMKPGRGANVRARGRDLLDDFLVGDSLLSRTVRDTAWGIGCCHPGQFETPVAGPDRPLRIALVMENLMGEQPHPVVASTINRTADLLSRLGHKVETVAMPVDGPAVANAFRTIWGYLAHAVVAGCRAGLSKGSLEDNLEPWSIGLAEWADTLPVDALEQVFVASGAAATAYDSFFDEWDVILSPVLKDPPPEIGRLGPTRAFPDLLVEMFDYVSYTPLHNMTGAPSLSLPLGAPGEHGPVGSLFSGRQGSEKLLLELALQLEQKDPWQDRWPSSSTASLLQ
jgi:amidase